MTAPLTNWTGAEREPIGIPAPTDEHRNEARLLSVSPKTAAASGHHRLRLTPRDDGATTQHEAGLTEWLERAGELHDLITSKLGALAPADAAPKMLADLHEHLRVGANMLKALQTQFAHAERLIEELDHRQAAGEAIIARLKAESGGLRLSE
ncbi:MAG TPA: hypothetical protein PK400_00355 [Phycisphaerales bacterium]|nr:hypothetical protein [Phycisphaerales bacterium]HRQ74505.1 hypothetical protein [Phycisphaerales bacterium]